jgi:hypothetical protein
VYVSGGRDFFVGERKACVLDEEMVASLARDRAG